MTNSTHSSLVTTLAASNLSVASFADLPALQNGEPAGMQRIIIPPGHLLTPHLHPDTNETTICLSGTGKVGIVSPDTSKGPIGGSLEESDFNKDSVVFLPQGYPHYFMNVSPNENLELLLTFENYEFNIITLADILQQLPDNVTEAAQQSAPKAEASPIIPYKVALSTK